MEIFNIHTLQNKDLLVFCPTRSRTDRVQEMISSFIQNTTKSTGLLFGIDEDDELLYAYMDIFNKNNLAYTINSFENNTQYINAVFTSLPEYKFYSVTNDDFVYMTLSWDAMLMNRMCISYGDDMYQGKNLPTTSVIDGDIIRALGWLQMPTLKYLYGDSVWKVLGLKLNILFYNPMVIIKHNHFLLDKSLSKDKIYMKTNSVSMYEADDAAFRSWIREAYFYDHNKIKSLIDSK
jgi:hypothetical protein